MAFEVSVSRTLLMSPSLMQAAHTMHMHQPTIQHTLISPQMPNGMDLEAFLASSAKCKHESNAPIVQMAGCQLNMNDQPVDHVSVLSILPKINEASLNPCFEAPMGTAMKNKTIMKQLMQMEKDCRVAVCEVVTQHKTTCDITAAAKTPYNIGSVGLNSKSLFIATAAKTSEAKP